MTTTVPTPAQIRLLRVAVEHEGGECAIAEAGLLADDALQWRNVQRTAAACERRGWIDAHGEITEAGKAVLAEHPEPAP